MTSALNLRRVDALDYRRNHAVASWRRDGHSVQLRTPPQQGCFITFWAQCEQERWQGMIDPYQWLSALWSDQGLLDPSLCTDDEIMALFSAVTKPVQLPPGMLDYTRLFDIELIRGDTLIQSQKLPCLNSEYGDVWLLNVPVMGSSTPQPLQPWVLELSLPLRAVIGATQLSLRDYQRLGAGDVLFVSAQSHQLLLADRCIGQFTFIEGGLQMQLTEQNIEQNTEQPTTTREVSALLVTLEFVLDERTLSVQDLNQLLERQVLALTPEANTHVELRVSGKCIAKGELVQLEDRLGVELSEVYRGNADE